MNQYLKALLSQFKKNNPGSEIPTGINLVERFSRNIPEVSREEFNEIWKEEITNYQHPISEKKSYTPKLDLAIQYLKANPATAKSNRKIAEELGISHPVVAQAKEIIRNE